jgi:hypothetical protein
LFAPAGAALASGAISPLYWRMGLCRSPSITLDVYGHSFSSSDQSAATVFERAFGGALTE